MAIRYIPAALRSDRRETHEQWLGLAVPSAAEYLRRTAFSSAQYITFAMLALFSAIPRVLTCQGLSY